MEHLKSKIEQIEVVRHLYNGVLLKTEKADKEERMCCTMCPHVVHVLENGVIFIDIVTTKSVYRC